MTTARTQPGGLGSIAHINALDGDARKAAIADYMVQARPMLLRIARRELGHGRHPVHLIDDFEQIVNETVIRLLNRDYENPGFIAKAGAWEAVVVRSVRNNLRTFVDSQVNNGGVSGAASVARRRRTLERVRTDLMNEMRREPTRQEIVDEANSRQAGRKDAQKQGMVFAANEIMPAAQAVDIDDVSDQLAVPADTTGGALLHTTECRTIVERTIAAAAGISEEHRVVAVSWIGEAAHPYRPFIRDEIKDIVEHTKLKRPVVVRVLSEVRDIARRLIADIYGFGEHDYDMA